MYLQVGETPLYIASWKGHGAVVKLLLEQHADVSICKKVMWLHRSSMCLYDFTILLQAGWTPQDGWTPLMAASSEGHTDVVQTLIEAKAQINTRKKVCCSCHQKTHIITHSVTVTYGLRYIHTLWIPLDC